MVKIGDKVQYRNKVGIVAGEPKMMSMGRTQPERLEVRIEIEGLPMITVPVAELIVIESAPETVADPTPEPERKPVMTREEFDANQAAAERAEVGTWYKSYEDYLIGEIVDGFIADFPTRQAEKPASCGFDDYPARYGKYEAAYDVLLNAEDLAWFKSRFIEQIEMALEVDAEIARIKGWNDAAWRYLINAQLRGEESACWRAWIINAECAGNQEAERWAIS